ncbi:MAG: hypothetical protein V1900_02670 [Candidatus Aenigmatarchaeota archaeon]
MEEDIQMIDNLELHRKDKFVNVSVNPRLYPLEVIYSSAYIFIDRAFVMIDGDPKEEILVQLRPKNDSDIEELGREFNNELLNYMVYLHRTVKNQGLRETIMRRALLTNEQDGKQEHRFIHHPRNEASYTEDPEKIAKPWKNKDECK